MRFVVNIGVAVGHVAFTKSCLKDWKVGVLEIQPKRTFDAAIVGEEVLS